MKVIGVERSAGSFVGSDKSSIQYDNCILYCTVPGQNVTGLKCFSIKIKTSAIVNSLGCQIPDIPACLIDNDIVIDYDYSYNPPRILGVSVQ